MPDLSDLNYQNSVGMQQAVGVATGLHQIKQQPFIDAVIERLGSLRENLKRASAILGEAGFYADPTAAKPPASEAPDTKRGNVMDMLQDLNQDAIGLVQQVNKVA